MINQLGLPPDMVDTLQEIFTKAKGYDPHLTEQIFITVIIKQWLGLFKWPQERRELKKGTVILRHDLKHAIPHSGKTQKKIAEETGLNKTYLSEIVQGKYDPSVTTALLIANALEWPPTKFMELFFLE